MGVLLCNIADMFVFTDNRFYILANECWESRLEDAISVLCFSDGGVASYCLLLAKYWIGLFF